MHWTWAIFVILAIITVFAVFVLTAVLVASGRLRTPEDDEEQAAILRRGGES